MSKPINDRSGYCPLWHKPLAKVCHTCNWYVQIRGMHPQTGEELDLWECSMAVMPLLMLEVSKGQRHTTASVDRLRNESREDANKQMIASVMGAKALLGKVK